MCGITLSKNTSFHIGHQGIFQARNLESSHARSREPWVDQT